MSSLNDLHPADVVYVIVKNCPSYFKQKTIYFIFTFVSNNLNTFTFK